MRSLLLVLALALLLSTVAVAVELETAAQVTLITPLDARLDHWGAEAEPAWAVAGTPGERVYLSLELRDTDGSRLGLDRGEATTLDPDGQILTTLPTPPADPHATAPVVTLVVCRE